MIPNLQEPSSDPIIISCVNEEPNPSHSTNKDMSQKMKVKPLNSLNHNISREQIDTPLILLKIRALDPLLIQIHQQPPHIVAARFRVMTEA
jgi:hypothetical protein